MVLESARVPVPVDAWFRQQGLSLDQISPQSTLQGVTVPSSALEDFRPVGSHLEWRLSEHYWATRGVLAFAENRVPYVVNNSGWLSMCLADLVFASCEAAPPAERWCIVELGCGSALCAKLLLDAFKLICHQKGRDYYDRLTYFATDGSPAAVAQWRERGVFAEHEQHVELLTLDAAVGLPLNLVPRAVICNYVLDVLPAAVVRRTEDGTLEQLCARTHLADERDIARLAGEPSLFELRELVAQDTPATREVLLQYATRFDLEVAFRTLDVVPPEFVDACAGAAPGERVLVNYGAIACVSNLLRALGPCSFVIINDYGPTQHADVAGHSSCQQFGSTTAFGLNFPLLERKLRQLDAVCLTPSGDATAALHSRLFSRTELPTALADLFELRFGETARMERERGLAGAREHAAAGRLDPALIAYRECLERNPRDWALLGEVTEFMIARIRDYNASISLAQAALRLNPVYSTWLWNLLGDALYSLERFDEAYDAYLQAERIDPRDVRTMLNLGYSLLQRGEHEAALQVLARGLAADTAGVYRDRLIAKQAEVIAALSARAMDEQRRQRERQGRLQGLPAQREATEPAPSGADSPPPAQTRS